MPIEIIGKIFELAITGSSAGLSMRRAIEETCLCLYNIAGVCRGWRAAVLAQTSLWNLIPIICYRGRHRTFITMRSAALAIERAECSNMRLAADLGLFRPAGSPVLEQLFRLKPRIHYVNLRTSGYFNLEEVLNPIIEIAGTDAITELSLCFEPSAVFMSERPDSYVLFGHNMDSQLPLFELSLGSVKVLRLKNVIFRAPNASLGILRELRLQDIMFDNSIALMETLKPLSTASRLERLDFIKIEVNDVNSHTPIPDISILLPNLRTLNIEDMSYEATHTVLCCIKPGSYQTVLLFSSILLSQLGVNIDSDKQNQCNILEQAIQPHGHSTLVIRTEGNDIESRALYELLHRLPSLTRVQIHTTSLSLALCSTLTQHPDPADLATGFPQFSQIYLNSESIHNIHEWQDSFVQMLSSHPLEEVILGGALRVLASEAFNVTGYNAAMNAHPLPEAPVAPELCTLDELFASEMDIWTSIRRLGKDVNKNALILQKWGRASSNEAVSDVMFHSANVLIKFSLALVQFSTHGEIIRNRLQAIRDVTNTPEHASQYKLYAPSPPGSSPDILLKADPAKICYDSPTIIRDLMKQKFAGMEELARKCNVLAYYGDMLTGELPSEEAVSATLAYKGKDRTAKIWHEAIREATQPRLGYLASRQDDEGGSETNNYGSPTPIEFDSSLSSLSSVTRERNRRWAIIDEDIKLVLARAGANDEVAQPLQVNVSPQERVLRGGMEATGKITIFMHAITAQADPLPLFNTPSSPLRKMFKSRPSGGMLGSVGAKIAHASTITALGNPDLRTLQDLITAEKGVLVGVQRLAGEIGKSAETLKTWGLGEGDDLGDVLSHSTNLLAQFSAALTQYASYEEQIRTQMKSIRSREEDLDEKKRRKRNVDNKADGADKKLAKMSPEHKSRMAQVELLNELKEEGRRLEIDIVNEEVVQPTRAAIGDYKRRATREFLGLKFAGMVELAEKTTIIGDLGKLMIEQIPLYTTPPGQPRPLYTSREKTAELSSEAMRCIGEVRINPPVLPEPTPATTTFQPFNHYNNSGPATPGTDHVNGVTGSTMPRGPNNFNEFGESQYSGPGGSGFSTGSLRIGEDGSRVGNTGAGEFHTLPARTSGFGSGLPPITLGDHGRDDTFSSSIADALSHDPTFSPQHAPTPPPHEPPQSSHQPTAPVGTYAPPPGPPPGAYQPRQLSESYFSNALPDPTQSHSPLMPPHGSPWATTPSAPAYSRPLPVHPLPDAEGQVAGFTHERDISPPPVFHPPAPPAPPVPSTSPPPVSHTIQAPSPPPVLAMPASPVPAPAAPAAPATPPAPPAANQPQPIPYADSLRDLSPSPPPVRDPSPAPAPRLDQHEASNPLVREESHEDIFAMYGSSNRNSAASPPPPPPQPQSPSNKPSLGVISAPTDALPPRTPSPPHIQTQESNYGTPSEYPNPFSSPLPLPPTLPTLSNVSPVTSPTCPGGSGRMISAGAFRRNVSRSDTLDPGSSLPPPVSPLSVRKKGLGGSEDISRGNSPVPASPGAPPIYSAIDGEGTSLGRSTSPPAGGSGGDSKAPQN
ncbi:hypothetical protein RhiTH_011670 [Rhizoctonia solani]